MASSTTYKSPLFFRPSFTGKETDCETGFSYFSARYYDPTLLTSWTAVDPMSDKYPSLSPYNYCAWNPMKLVDPDGRDVTESNDWYKDANGYVHWDANVHSQADLEHGKTYIGRTVCMVAEGDDKIIYGNQYGQIHSSVPLPAVSITADRLSSNNQQRSACVDNVSFGTALETAMIGEACGHSYTDYVPLEEANIAKGFNVTGKIMQTTGRLVGFAGVAYTTVNALDDGNLSVGEGLRIGLQSTAVATSFIPVYGTAISLGLTAIDFFFGDAIEKMGSK